MFASTGKIDLWSFLFCNTAEYVQNQQTEMENGNLKGMFFIDCLF